MAHKFTPDERIKIKRFIITQNLTGATQAEVHRRSWAEIGMYLSPTSGIIKQLQNECEIEIANNTEAAVSEARIKVCNAISNSVDVETLVTRWAELADEYYNCLTDPQYDGPFSRPTNIGQVERGIKEYGSIVTNIMRFVPRDESIDKEDLDPRFREGHIKDVMAAIDEKDDVFYQPWLNADRSKAGGVKRSQAENQPNADNPKGLPGDIDENKT